MSRSVLLSIGVALVLVTGLPAAAQPLGSFTWQLQPYCNRVTVNVRQDGGVYTLDGTDDQCGAAQKAPVVGVAAPNPDGSIGFGFNIVSPGGQAVPVQARMSVATLSGTWRDSGGLSGTFAFGGALAGLPRPTPAAPGDITGVTAGAGLTGGGTSGDITLGVDPAVVQSRVTTACPAGEALRSIQQNGTAVCEPITGSAGGDITAVNAGLGLTGGGATGDVTLHAVFGGDGVVNAAARSDHQHVANATSVAIGPGALPLGPGTSNTAVGTLALNVLASGFGNTAVGHRALAQSTEGIQNTALGSSAMLTTTTGSDNTALGEEALSSNTTGSNNTAVGENALEGNVTGSLNTAVGVGADVASGALVNATAIGALARVDQSNSLVLGGINGINGATADTRVGIGTSTPSNRLEVVTDSSINNVQFTKYTSATSGFLAPLVGLRRARGSAAAPSAVVAGDGLGSVFFSGHSGSGFGGGASLRVEATEDWGAGVNGTRLRVFTTANGSGTQDEVLRIEHSGNVGIGTTFPTARLHVAGTAQIGETLQVDLLGAAGAVPLCRNASNQIAACSSSLRYKRDVRPFDGGLTFLQHLKPISFAWKDGGAADVGFGAEDVAAIDPLFAVFNPDGTVEGVKYDRLTTVLVNAVKELGARNEALAQQNAALERRLAALEAVVAGRRE